MISVHGTRIGACVKSENRVYSLRLGLAVGRWLFWALTGAKPSPGFVHGMLARAAAAVRHANAR